MSYIVNIFNTYLGQLDKSFNDENEWYEQWEYVLDESGEVAHKEAAFKGHYNNGYYGSPDADPAAEWYEDQVHALTDLGQIEYIS